jgi:excisionase family DNA binding protein
MSAEIQEQIARDGDEDELLTVEELMAWLKVTRRWVYDQVARGAIPVRRVGRFLRFHRGDILEWSRRPSEAG